MYNSILRPALSLLSFTCLSALLLSCRTTVPQPSLPVHDLSKTIAAYKMHNIGPQQEMNSQAVYFADLNKDGHMDLLIGGHNSMEGFNIEWGDSSGNWSLQSGPATAMQPRSFATSDINHDHNPDIIISGEGDQKGIQVWQLDLQTQTWSLHSTPIDNGIFNVVKAADLNRDGWDDIIAARSGTTEDGGILVLLNGGNGRWVTGTPPTLTGHFTDLSVADLNNDGNPDIIASRRGGVGTIQDDNRAWKQTGGIQIWYGDGNARWQPQVLATPSDAESVTVADVNRDGQMDIIAGLYQHGIQGWLGDDGQWDEFQVTDKGTWSTLRVGDINTDGQKELVAASSIGHGIQLWSWKGSDFQSKSRQLPNYGTYLDIDLGEALGDGQLAIAAANAQGGVEVWSFHKAKPLPLKQVVGSKKGKPLSIYFESGSARLTTEALQSLREWHKQLNQMSLKSLRFNLQGTADLMAIKSDLYPNNAALSQARADSVAAWLVNHGAGQHNISIDAIGDSTPFPLGTDPLSLKKNRRVTIQAYQMETTRLPLTSSDVSKRDLYNISENKVFKTIDGIPEYKVDMGDELQITFWQGGKPEIQKVTVQIDGTVSLPYQSALKVSGYTPREIDKLTTEILRKYERNPRVDVQVLKAKSKFASVFGEVQSLSRQPTGPGTYALRGKESLVDFLSRVGGPSKEANLNSVQIIREGKTVLLNLNRAIRQGDLSENAIIDDGDTIFVPSLAQSKRQVYVLGQVAKAGIVEFTGEINFLDAISKSGGLTDQAYLPDIRVLRADRDQPQILAVNFQRFLEEGDLTQNLALMDKDIIIIPSRPIANWNKFVSDISPSITLLLQPVSVAQQILSLRLLSGQVK